MNTEDFDYSDGPEDIDGDVKNFEIQQIHSPLPVSSKFTASPVPSNNEFAKKASHFTLDMTTKLYDNTTTKNKNTYTKLSDIFKGIGDKTYTDNKFNPHRPEFTKKSILVFYYDQIFLKSTLELSLKELIDFLPKNWKLITIPIKGNSYFEIINLD
jgi:hypothetical protein